MGQSAVVFVVLQFAVATLLPVVTSLGVLALQTRTRFGTWSYGRQQTAIGVLFGLVAVFGTEAGIATHDATMNVRDAAPLAAGLLFGGPAGIIAGLIGGVERYFAALWGRGMFTRVACSLATAASGFFAAGIRTSLLEGRRPSWPMSLSAGVVAEVLHLLLILVTNLNNSLHALRVVQACLLPMVLCNAVSVALASFTVGYAADRAQHRKPMLPNIAAKVQSGMLRVVIVGLVATSVCTAVLQSNMSYNATSDVLEQSLRDVAADIRDASDANLLEMAWGAAIAIPTTKDATDAAIRKLLDLYNISRVNVVDTNGIIVASSEKSVIGYDMASSPQSAEFLSLLPGGPEIDFAQSYQPTSQDDGAWFKYAGVGIRDGFVQVGYDSDRFIVDLVVRVGAAVANRHVGSSGFIVVLSEYAGTVTRNDVYLNEQDMSALNAAIQQSNMGEQFRVNLRGQTYICMYGTAEGLEAVATMPLEEAMSSRDLSVILATFMEVIVLALLFAAIYILIKLDVVDNIVRVNGRLGEITQGDLQVQVDVRDSSEFASLSDGINTTVAALRDAIAAEGKRIERDLKTAKSIQESALPRTFPPFPDIQQFDLYASMNAAREVGGDFYDFFMVSDHTLCFLIADVSGKGIPASLFMMAAKSELANNIKSGMPLNEAVRHANWNLCQGNDAGMFVTVWAATLDYVSGELTYVNAGHNYPLLRHDGQWRWIDKRCGLFLGTFEIAKYQQETLTLVPGDQLLLYTDGVNEAFSADEEEYGNDRLEAFLQENAQTSPHMLVDLLSADLRRWSEGAEQSDDITMLCIEYGVPPEVSGAIYVPPTAQGRAQVFKRLEFETARLLLPNSVRDHIKAIVGDLFGDVCELACESASAGESANNILFACIFDVEAGAATMSFTTWGEAFEHAWDKEYAVDDLAYVRDGRRNVIAFRMSWAA